MSNILYQSPPEVLRIGTTDYPINTDFRIALKSWLLIDDKEVEDTQRFSMLLSFFYTDEIPPYIEEALNGIYWFMACGKSVEEIKEADTEEDTEPDFDYEQDAELIYAAFMQVYNIDLTTAKFHWWKFKALLSGMPAVTKLHDIIHVRTMEVPEGATASERMRILELKQKYTLQKNLSEEDRIEKAEREFDMF